MIIKIICMILLFASGLLLGLSWNLGSEYHKCMEECNEFYQEQESQFGYLNNYNTGGKEGDDNSYHIIAGHEIE